jgi:DNA mismatch repair protein MutS2
MGFDDATLEPTYVLRTGAPGKSAGLDIASRLGLPTDLIDRARAAMSHTERDIARFLAELHDKIEENTALQMELRRKVEDVRKREESLAKEWEKRESAKLREIEKKYDDLVARFDEQARNTIDEIMSSAEQRKAADQARRKVSKTKREFQEQLQSTVLPADVTPAKPILRIEEGSRVVLKGIRQPARVRRVLDDGTIEVDAGLMKMRVSRDDVQDVLPADGEQKLPKNVTFQPGPRWDVPYQEINVIGQRAEDAVDEVEKFLDRAAMASVERVRIVHGHGMGILKRAISDLLGKSPHVEKFYAASQNEGGTGATIAELKAG